MSKMVLAFAFTGLLFATGAHADTMAHCSAAWKAKTTEATSAGTYQAWSKTCLAKGYTVPASASVASTTAAAPRARATAQCKDGTYSMSKTAKGRCSSHGGVAKAL